MGLRIFLHSVRLVFGQLGAALRISAVLYIIGMAIGAIGLYYQYQAFASEGSQAGAWQFFVAALISVVPYLWIAVAWHRFVLLDEAPRAIVPTPPGDRIWSYFGRAIQMGLLIIVFAIGCGLLLTVAMVASNGSPVLALPIMFVFVAVGVLITYRLAPMFPGAAIGQSVGVGEAWKVTSGASGTFFILAILSAIGSFVLDLPGELLARLPGSPFTVLTWVAVSSWVKLMVGVSILTTIYGVYVEKRSIS